MIEVRPACRNICSMLLKTFRIIVLSMIMKPVPPFRKRFPETFLSQGLLTWIFEKGDRIRIIYFGNLLPTLVQIIHNLNDRCCIIYLEALKDQQTISSASNRVGRKILVHLPILVLWFHPFQKSSIPDNRLLFPLFCVYFLISFACSHHFLKNFFLRQLYLVWLGWRAD